MNSKSIFLRFTRVVRMSLLSVQCSSKRFTKFCAESTQIANEDGVYFYLNYLSFITSKGLHATFFSRTMCLPSLIIIHQLRGFVCANSRIEKKGGWSNAREEEGIREIIELISFLCSSRHNSAINILAQ